MLITKEILVINSNFKKYESLRTEFIFGGNTFQVSLGKNSDEYSGSEHWFSEPSDFFKFDSNNKLVFLGLSIPGMNGNIDFLEKEKHFISLTQLKGFPFIVSPMKIRQFNSKNRTLTCVDKSVELSENLRVFYLKDEIGLIFSNNLYAGYIFHDPLAYLTNKNEGIIDVDMLPDQEEYQLMEYFFEIMSDNQLNKKNDDMSLIVKELDERIIPYLMVVKSEFRRLIIKESIDDLRDFYM